MTFRAGLEDRLSFSSRIIPRAGSLDFVPRSGHDGAVDRSCARCVESNGRMNPRTMLRIKSTGAETAIITKRAVSEGVRNRRKRDECVDPNLETFERGPE